MKIKDKSKLDEWRDTLKRVDMLCHVTNSKKQFKRDRPQLVLGKPMELITDCRIDEETGKITFIDKDGDVWKYATWVGLNYGKSYDTTYI